MLDTSVDHNNRPPKLAVACWMALLPTALLPVMVYWMHRHGLLGDQGLGVGLVFGLVCTGLFGVQTVLLFGRSAPASGQRPAASVPSGPNELGCGKALFDIFMAHLPALAFLKDRRGRYLYVNAACQNLWKRSPTQIVGRSDSELWPDEIARPLCQNDDRVMDSDQVFTAVDRLVVGGEERFHLMTKFSVPAGQEPLLGGIALDITDKVHAEQENARLEQQLIQSQKMEAIGTLAGGIAHDFNNVLAAIMGYVELAQFDTQLGRSVHHELAQVLKATHRARDLVRQILTFSRKTDHDRQPLDPKPLVEEALTMLRASIPSTIDIQQHIDVDGLQVMADATMFHQVMMNLCTNAAHAMEDTGGVLQVHLQKVSLTRITAGRLGVAPGRYLEVRVRDQGPGIPPALCERIFDPYFTTKPRGKGTGMGLAVVRSIVESHGGSIDVQSRPGSGACFCVLLPVTQPLSEILPEKTDRLPRGSESILFVDDEPSLADLGKQMLGRLGYQVTCCRRSLDALALVEEQPGAFDMVVTDLTMPHMTGDVLAAKLLAVRPDLPIILCTGYSEYLTEDRAAQLGVSACLMKPLTLSDLAKTLRSVLDRADRWPIDPPLKAASDR